MSKTKDREPTELEKLNSQLEKRLADLGEVEMQLLSLQAQGQQVAEQKQLLVNDIGKLRGQIYQAENQKEKK